jgi:lipoprotein NlpD
MRWRWPTKGKVVSTFSEKDRSRRGIDIQGVDNQPVYAAESGKVVYSGSGLVGYGNLIILKHNDEYLSAYGYNNNLMVHEGTSVKRGEQISTMGTPHNGAEAMLHFEIRNQGKPVNPLRYLP